jgi:hypothetical protein
MLYFCTLKGLEPGIAETKSRKARHAGYYRRKRPDKVIVSTYFRDLNESMKPASHYGTTGWA